MDGNDLKQLTLDFTEAFNRADLEAVMAYFTEDAIYDEFNGARSTGKADIRAALLPQFEGAFGRIEFDGTDLFVDQDQNKVMISWKCHIEKGERRGYWQGLDLLHFRDGKVAEKHTYSKTEKPLMIKER